MVPVGSQRSFATKTYTHLNLRKPNDNALLGAVTKIIYIIKILVAKTKTFPLNNEYGIRSYACVSNLNFLRFAEKYSAQRKIEQNKWKKKYPEKNEDYPHENHSVGFLHNFTKGQRSKKRWIHTFKLILPSRECIGESIIYADVSGKF